MVEKLVTQCFSADKQYDTCFQKSSYLPWRLKFGHLGASGYQIYFSVYRVDHGFIICCSNPYVIVVKKKR